VAVQFPDYIEAFVEHTKFFLEGWDVKLVPEKVREQELIQSYRARTVFGTTELILFQVNRPTGPPDYRARARTALPKEYDAVFRGCETIPNSFATLGALVPGKDTLNVWSQCIVHKEAIVAEAGTMAAAIVHAAPSITEGMRAKLMQEEPERFAALCGGADTVARKEDHDVSAWSELDFERLQRKRPDFRISQSGERQWAVNFAGSDALILLAAVDEGPYFGPGLFSLMWMPNDEIEPDGKKVSVNDLNFADVYVGEAPTFGAWCGDRYAFAEHRQKYQFVSFAPNLLKALPDFTEHFVDWSIIRAGTTKQRLELLLNEGRQL
jgi:hypothetical protein